MSKRESTTPARASRARWPTGQGVDLLVVGAGGECQLLEHPRHTGTEVRRPGGLVMLQRGVVVVVRIGVAPGERSSGFGQIAFRPLDTEAPGQVSGDRLARKRSGLLFQEAYPRTRRVEHHVATVGRDHSREDLQQGGLAGTVGSDHGKSLPRGDGQGHLGEHTLDRCGRE